MKALEKDRTRRYTSPNEMAQDIQRHLEGREPRRVIVVPGRLVNIVG